MCIYCYIHYIHAAARALRLTVPSALLRHSGERQAPSRCDAENPWARVPCGVVGERERGRGKEEAGREAPKCSPGTMEHKWLQMDCEGDRAEAEASLKGEGKRG